MSGCDDLSDFLTNYRPPRNTAGRPGSPIAQLGDPSSGSPTPVSSESRVQTPAPLPGNRTITPNVNDCSEIRRASPAPSLDPIDPELRLTPLSLRTPEPTANKRRYDLQQYANREVVSKRLKGEHKDAFVKWTKAGPEEREAAMGSMIFALQQQLSVLAGVMEDSRIGNNAEGSWTVPTSAAVQINKYAIRILLSDNIAQYDGNVPLLTLQSIITSKSWGFPADMKTKDEVKWEKVLSYARDCLTQRKSDIKKMLVASFNPKEEIPLNGVARSGQHIYTLCSQLATSIGSKSGADINVTVTVEMCVRIAFLRWRLRTFTKSPIATDPRTQKTKDYSRHFWQFVDIGLTSIRAQAEGDEAIIHDMFVQILERDQTTFPAQLPGQNDVRKTLRNVAPSDVQRELSNILTTAELGGEADNGGAGHPEGGDD